MSDIEKNKNKKKTVVLLSIISAILVICIGFCSFVLFKASSDNIYEGVRVGELNLGGMNKSNAIRTLAKTYDTHDINVRVNCEGIEFDIYGSAYSL
ncbi:MAG: hypothetical protein J6R68_02305, partial [Clostridia bacterium]|nr:hypothetical protein [Clostridia bacterium]